MKKIILFLLLGMTGGLQAMSSMPMPKTVELPNIWSVSFENSTCYIFAPQAHTPMIFSMDQINHIVASMNSDQQALIMYGSTTDGMTQLIKYITDHSITPANVSSLSSSSSSSSSMPDFMRVRDRMRALADTMSHRMAVPKTTIHGKCLEYRAMQMSGDISKLQFEKRVIQTEIGDVPSLFLNTIWGWTGWVESMKHRIRVIDFLLNQEITQQLHTIQTGKLCDAEAVVSAILARWPYNQVITSRDEHLRVQEYINKVGFDEWQVAQNLIAKRPDYQKKIADQKAELARQQELKKQQEIAKQQEAELVPKQELEKQKQKEAELASQKQTAASMFKSILPQGMQHEIIDVLGNSKNHAAVAQQLDAKVQDVLRQAELNNVLIHPELDWRLQAALKSLPKSVNAKEFTFHLATVEHLVNDIQLQVASEQKSLIERSPSLLAQAVTKYFEYLSPTEMELSLIVDLARYVSDTTTGTEYLSAEVRKQRIAQFWQVIDSLSFDSLSSITAEQVIDSASYVAARATYVMGARAALSVVKNLKHVGAGAARGAALFAERFVKAFDSVIGANPVLITNEGTVVWNASPEAATEARQLVQAYDGMKDKPSSKPPAEILDDTKKIVENESKLETKTVGDLIRESKPGEIKKYARIYEKTGRYEEAMRDFECLGPSDVKPMPDGKVGKIGKLADGRTVIVREHSSDGRVTLEIQSPEVVGKALKIRYGYK